MNRILLLILALVTCLLPAHADEKSDLDVLGRKSAPWPQRKAAAKSLADRAKKEGTCEKTVNAMLQIAVDDETYQDIRLAIFDAIVSCDGEGVRKLVAKKIGHGKAGERMVLLQAARALSGPEIDKALIEKGLSDDRIENRALAVAILAQHRPAEARPALEAVLKAQKDAALVGPAVSALAALYDGTSDWATFEDRLLAYVADKNDALRRAALAAIAKGQNPARIDLFTAQMSHPDWSTRAIALGYLEKSRTRQGIGAIVAQLQHEERGTRMSAECVDALMRLTGMNFADRAADWAAWWQNNESTFEFPKAADAPRTEAPKRHEGETKVVQFYGIEVESKRVSFVVDVSLSMQEVMTDGENAGLTRLDVAKRELAKIIDGLEPGTLFNIISFCRDVEPWLDQVGDLPAGLGGKKPAAGTTGTAGDKEQKDEKQRQKEAEALKKFDENLRSKARKYVEKLELCESTNIHDSLEFAFQDPNVDTIFFMTDGEPNMGREVDPTRIREAVRRWNETRKIEICAISIGKDMDLLKWLAEDSGGQHRFFK